MSNIKTVNINSMMKKMITIGVMDARLFCGHCQICHPYCRSVDDGCQLKDVMVDIGYARHARIQQKRSPQMYYINIARSAEREWMVKRMDDLISRQAAIDALCDNCDNPQAVCPHYPCNRYTAIEALPSAQPDWNEMIVICDCCGHAIHVKRL